MTEAATAATDQRWRNGGGHGGPIDVEEAYYVCRNSHNGLSSRLFRLSGEDLGGFGNDGPREGLGGMFV